jgi:hypothetical protein
MFNYGKFRYNYNTSVNFKEGNRGMDSDFINKEITNTEKVNLCDENYIRRILNAIKSNKEVSIFIGLITTIIIGIIIFVNLMSVSVLNNEEIRQDLIGKIINVNGKEIEITDSNLNEVMIINRFTEKYETDVANVEFKVNLDNSKVVEMATLKFNYVNNKWIYSSGDIGNIKNIETGASTEGFIQELIQKDGISIITGERYYGSSIKKISNIQFGDYNADGGKKFTADIVLSNGACYQNCNINGEISFDINEDTWKIVSTDMNTKDTVYKEDKIDMDIIKNIVLDEITDGSSYEFKSGNNSEYINISKDDIVELNIKDYVIRDDSTVRVEIDGKAKSDKVLDMSFNGFVSINGKLSYGVIRNSKDIKIYGTNKDVLNGEKEEVQG